MCSSDLGGCLCVETSMHSVCVIDTKNVIVSIDGRKVHWVDPRYVGDRWSVVWYRRDVGKTEPVVDEGVVLRWWAREEKSSWVHAKNPAVPNPVAVDADDTRVKRHKRGSN